MQELIESIKKNEGCRLHPYLCTAHKITIGWGRNLTDVGISHAEAELLLKADIARVIEDFYRLPIEAIQNCNANRRRVLCEMIFNLGLTGVLGFQKMLAAIEAGDFKTAADEMLSSLWAEQVGTRAQLMAQTMREG